MLPEPEKVSGKVPEDSLGSLSGCLVDGDAEQRTRERRVKRRALAISVALQCAVLTVLVLVPLFAKTERIATKGYVPLPPYGHRGSPQRDRTRPTPIRPTNPHADFIVFNSQSIKPHLPDGPSTGPVGNPEDPIGNQLIGPGCDSCIDIGGKGIGIRPPQPVETHAKPQLVHVGTIDPAMLIHRVEPVYPPLARQTHRDGRVELRAIIGTDGTIQSLQIVVSDPLFNQSAMEAVRQWRYRPTILNGQPVEIDTYITVIYTTQH
jgi:TonB family protein